MTEPTPECLLLARRPGERRMAMLRAHLTRKEHELLGAVTVGIDVHQDLKADLSEAAEAEVGNLDLPSFVIADDDAGSCSDSTASARAWRSSSRLIMAPRKWHCETPSLTRRQTRSIASRGVIPNRRHSRRIRPSSVRRLKTHARVEEHG